MVRAKKGFQYYAVDGLRACRFAVGLTQKELAEAIGSHQTRIAELEDERNATRDVFDRLCEALGVFAYDLTSRIRSKGWQRPDSQWWHAADLAERARWESL